MKDLGNFEDDLAIDKTNLIEEWINHSGKYYHYASSFVEAQDEAVRKKEALEALKARADFEVRNSDPGDYGLQKFSEASIASIVLQDSRVVSAIDAYNSAKKRAAMFQIGKECFEHRKKALEFLSQFWLAGFFSEPDSAAMNDKVFKQLADKKINKK